MSALNKKFKVQDPAQDTQPIKGWTGTEEVFDSFQILFVATYHAIVRLGSVAYI